MTKIGYARVSTRDKDHATQEARLKAAGCEIVRAEKASRKSHDGRDQLAAIPEFIRQGDELVVVKLDRLGRSTRDVLNLVHELEQKGAGLRVLEPEFCTSGDTGRIYGDRAGRGGRDGSQVHPGAPAGRYRRRQG